MARSIISKTTKFEKISMNVNNNISGRRTNSECNYEQFGGPSANNIQGGHAAYGQSGYSSWQQRVAHQDLRALATISEKWSKHKSVTCVPAMLTCGLADLVCVAVQGGKPQWEAQA